MITKQFLKSKPVCKATFTLEAEAAPAAKKVALVGEFNGWNPETGIEMKKQKDGAFKAVVELEAGNSFYLHTKSRLYSRGGDFFCVISYRLSVIGLFMSLLVCGVHFYS